jgi:hypothetical protein
MSSACHVWNSLWKFKAFFPRTHLKPNIRNLHAACCNFCITSPHLTAFWVCGRVYHFVLFDRFDEYFEGCTRAVWIHTGLPQGLNWTWQAPEIGKMSFLTVNMSNFTVFDSIAACTPCFCTVSCWWYGFCSVVYYLVMMCSLKRWEISKLNVRLTYVPMILQVSRN